MGLAPVFAAALGAACCLGIPLLVALFGGAGGAAASGAGPDLLTLVIIGFALGGVLVVAIQFWRSTRGSRQDAPETRNSTRNNRGC